MKSENAFDVIVVGASVAGCAAAALYARQGLRVALIERRNNLDAFKVMCTHYVQACATPTMRRLGIADELERRGAVRNSLNIWTKYGWIRPFRTGAASHHGYNVRRRLLDPLMRETALAEPLVNFFPCTTLEGLVEHDGRVCGVSVRATGGVGRDIKAKIVVGADGRYSKTAKFAGAKERVTVNKRTFIVTYYRNLPLVTGSTSQLWFLNPNIAYAFPNDEGLTLLCAGLDAKSYAQYREQPQQYFEQLFSNASEGPDMQAGERVEKFVTGKDQHTIRRSHAKRGLTLVGDAKLASDPYPGVGIGWALQGAEWLVEHTAEALLENNVTELDAGLKAYDRLHRRQLSLHADLIANFSSARTFRALLPPEKLFFAAATEDQVIAEHLDKHLNRLISVPATLAPRMLLRALRVVLRRTFSRAQNNPEGRTPIRKLPQL